MAGKSSKSQSKKRARAANEDTKKSLEEKAEALTETPEESPPSSPAAAAGIAERAARGRSLRAEVPLESHGQWAPAADRPDPVAILEEQSAERLLDLLPVRYGRMVESPFAFYRGSAIVMAQDLATTPRTGITVQVCGDAHLSNFGAFASPERHLLFDLNDFDETLPGPWEWDVKRLATSFVLAGRGNGFRARDSRAAAETAVQTYREAMGWFAGQDTLAIWYSKIDTQEVLELMHGGARKQVKKGVAKAHTRDSLQALSKLTAVVDGQRRIVDDPPLVIRIPPGAIDVQEAMRMFGAYRRSLQDDRRHLLERFRYVDGARKVVGVGSVGTRCFILLFEGQRGDPLFLQLKEAEPSVLERHVGKSQYKNNGQRVVAGQRLMQAASDIFLGWIRGPAGRDFYMRQLRDWKASIPVESFNEAILTAYARLCGTTLARSHARSGDAVSIASYLGTGPEFDIAVAEFAVAYADQAERDHGALGEAVANGRIEARSGI